MIYLAPYFVNWLFANTELNLAERHTLADNIVLRVFSFLSNCYSELYKELHDSRQNQLPSATKRNNISGLILMFLDY